jgi:hypothetical protein
VQRPCSGLKILDCTQCPSLGSFLGQARKEPRYESIPTGCGVEPHICLFTFFYVFQTESIRPKKGGPRRFFNDSSLTEKESDLNSSRINRDSNTNHSYPFSFSLRT